MSRSHTSQYTWDDWNAEKICELGEGGQGKCWLVQQTGDGAVAVLKSVSNKKSKTDKSKPAEEARVLAAIVPPSERITEFYMATVDPIGTHLYLEHCDGGDLHEFVRIYRMNDISIPEAFIWHSFAQLTEALAWIHYGASKCQPEPAENWVRVIHRDIKPANVFLKLRDFGGFNYPNVKLGDFGLAAVTSDPGHTSDFQGGTYEWQPPERPDATAKGDVWSLGAIVHALAHGGKSPLGPLPESWSNSHYNLLRWREHPKARQPTPIHRYYSQHLEHWMLTALRSNPADRLSSLQLLQKFVPRATISIARAWKPIDIWTFEIQQDHRWQADSNRTRIHSDRDN